LATKDGAKLISITAGDLYAKGNYQDLQRYPEVDLAIAADAETTLPSLTEAVKRLITDDRKRRTKIAAASWRMLVRDPGTGAHRSDLRLGLEPDHHGSFVG